MKRVSARHQKEERQKPGPKPKLKNRVNTAFTMTQEHLDLIDQYAKEHDIENRSAVVRRAIRIFCQP